MSIRIILLDIDGTLTNSQKVITPKTKEALLRAQSNGITLALSSGRPEQGLTRWARELKMFQNNGLFICFNGGKVINCRTGEVLYNHPIPPEDARAVLKHLKKFDVVPMVTHGEYAYVTNVFNHDIPMPDDFALGNPFNVLEYEAHGNNYMLCEKRDLAECADFPVNKVLTYAAPAYLQAHHAEMAAPFADRLNAMFTADFYFEFTAKGVDKAHAIASALTPLGYKREEMIAFGDAQNDSTMLRYVGTGVAMGNAMPEVKAIADYVTATNDEDGIAKALYRFLPELFPEEQGE